MQKVRIALVALCLPFATTSALAGSPSTKTTTTQSAKRGESDCARARKAGRACSLIFDNDTVDGGVPTALGSSIAVYKAHTRTSLIRIRRSFRDKIIRAGETL